jgi:single-strand DNA-binding protein
MQKNQIELAGHLAAKPTVRVLPSGTKVANARIAEGYRYTDKQSKSLREHTNWHNLVFYGILADIAATYDKGENVCVEGSLQTRKFTPKDGSERTVYEIIVKTCHLVEVPRTKYEPPAANEPGPEHDLAADQQAAGVISTLNEWPA